MHWQTTRFNLDLTRPWVMGIVNLTPDSFSDGGQHAQGSQALLHAERLLREGAGILDVGAESTRPGAQAVPLEDELARLMPFLREAVRWQVPISVDTYKPEVMQAVLDIGVDIVNDIWALRQPGAERVVVAHPSCGVCLMHMHRDPKTMQLHTMTGDVVSDVKLFLQARMKSLLAQGVDAARLVLGSRHWIWQNGDAKLRIAGPPSRVDAGRTSHHVGLVAKVVLGGRAEPRWRHSQAR
jgi:dihydropteroate synthase